MIAIALRQIAQELLRLGVLNRVGDFCFEIQRSPFLMFADSRRIAASIDVVHLQGFRRTGEGPQQHVAERGNAGQLVGVAGGLRDVGIPGHRSLRVTTLNDLARPQRLTCLATQFLGHRGTAHS